MRQANGIAAAAAGVLLALTAGVPARAQLGGPCSFYCSMHNQGKCVETRQVLGCGCGGSCESPSAPAPSYGAMAYGATSRAWGSFYHWASQVKAESEAMQNCSQHGNDCQVLVWFKRQCGAVASGEGTAAFWGLGDSEDHARADAQNKCVDGGGKNCEVQASACSM